MAEQDVEILEVLISQMGKRRKIDAVVGKSLSVLLKPEVFEPTSNLLHRRPLRIKIIPPGPAGHKV